MNNKKNEAKNLREQAIQKQAELDIINQKMVELGIEPDKIEQKKITEELEF